MNYYDELALFKLTLFAHDYYNFEIKEYFSLINNINIIDENDDDEDR